MSLSQIQYLQRKDIDTVKWDGCVEAAQNGLIYARSWWLDTVAHNWDAIVFGDYEIIMPLPWKKKYGIKYLYQPPFTQQLGVISSITLREEMMLPFIIMAKKRFRFAEISLNFANEISGTAPRNNSIAPLISSYEEIAADYENILKKNLKVAHRYGITIKDGSSLIGQIIDLFDRTYADRGLKKDLDVYERLKKVMTDAHDRKMLIAVYAINEHNEICTAALVPKCSKRLYFLLSVTPADKRKYCANHYLIDRLIHQHASSDLLWDFEGSDIEGISQFNEYFTPFNQAYYFLKWNNLSWPISMFKK